jgi:hypothetical protein
MLYKDRPSDEPAPAPKAKAAASRADAEELARNLRVAVRRRNEKWARGRRITAVVLLVLLAGFLAWWFWPRVTPARAHVVALDQLTVPGQPSTLRAATEAVDAKAEYWGGQDVYFQELKLQLVAGEVQVVPKVRSDDKGLATMDRTFSATHPFALVEARMLDERTKPAWNPSSQARVFAWPATTPLLVVELAAEVKDNAAQLAALSAALRLAERRGWKVAYLGTAPERPLKYQELRDWAQGQMGEGAAPEALPVEAIVIVAGGAAGCFGDAGESATGIPSGPVLGRLRYFDGAAPDAARDEVLAALKKQFQGRIVRAAVGGGKLTVQVLQGPGAEAVRAGSWEQLVPLLPKANQ